MEAKYLSLILALFLILGVFFTSGCGKTQISEIQTGEQQISQQQIQQQTQATWHKVTTFSGVNDKTTDAFNIQGNKFKIKYNAEAENEYSLLTITIYREGSNMMTDSIMARTNLNDETIVYEGKGNFYLKIGAANLKSWSIEVEDYY